MSPRCSTPKSTHAHTDVDHGTKLVERKLFFHAILISFLFFFLLLSGGLKFSVATLFNLYIKLNKRTNKPLYQYFLCSLHIFLPQTFSHCLFSPI